MAGNSYYQSRLSTFPARNCSLHLELENQAGNVAGNLHFQPEYAAHFHLGRARGESLPSCHLPSALLYSDPANPTRMGNSVNRDTCPDLPFIKNIRNAQWGNTEENLGSDHYIIKISFFRKPSKKKVGIAKLTDWNKFWNEQIPPIRLTEGFTKWAQHIHSLQRRYSTNIYTTYGKQEGLSLNAGKGKNTTGNLNYALETGWKDAFRRQNKWVTEVPGAFFVALSIHPQLAGKLKNS